MSAHTPGLWEALANGEGMPLQRVGVTEGPEVGGGYSSHAIALVIKRGTDEETTANSRLIAAAPELLAFAKQLAARGIADSNTMDKCRAAIAKATGSAV